MADANSVTMFVTPLPEENTGNQEEGPGSARREGKRPMPSEAEQRAAKRPRPATPTEVIALDDEGEDDLRIVGVRKRPEQVTFTAPDDVKTTMPKTEVLEFGRGELLTVVRKRFPDVEDGSKLKTKLEDIVDVLQQSDKKKILHRWSYSWRRTLLEVETQLKKEVKEGFAAWDLLWRQEDFDACEEYLRDRREKRVEDIGNHIRYAQAIIDFLKDN